VITRLLGIPVVDETKCLEWAIKLIDFPWDPDGAMAARAEFDGYMADTLERSRINPGDDLISMMAAAEIDGQKLTTDEMLSFLRLLFPAGSDTTYKIGGSLFYCVLNDPTFLEMAKQSDVTRAALVSEALRWQPPVALQPRMASADCVLGGADIKKGDLVLAGIAGANNDPSVFPDPRRFDPSRPNTNILTFGYGMHFCLGTHLARRELQTALRVIFERFPDLALSPDQEVSFHGGLIRGPDKLMVRPNARSGATRSA